MRIGISGAAGTGKTTLAEALAKHHEIPLIGDPTLRALREHGRNGWRGVSDLGERRSIRKRAFAIKIAEELENPSFVSDKTVVDFLAYWMLNQAPGETEEQNLEVLELVKEHLHVYDYLFVLPWRQQIEPAEGRNNDPIHQLRIQACLEGLYSVLNCGVFRADYTFGEDLAGFIDRALLPPLWQRLQTKRPLKSSGSPDG